MEEILWMIQKVISSLNIYSFTCRNAFIKVVEVKVNKTTNTLLSEPHQPNKTTFLKKCSVTNDKFIFNFTVLSHILAPPMSKLVSYIPISPWCSNYAFTSVDYKRS
jgi:hypothetical protein